MTSSDRLQQAFDAFDRANAADPNLESVDGQSVPKELIYGRRMSDWLERLCPDASEALRLAARSQHLERWVTPRAGYPEGRTGYLTWRRDLKRYHAERAGEILTQLGYDGEVVARVQALIRKERLKRDEEAQVLEDVVCVVFLAHYFADFAAKHADDKVIAILRKTWAKMSPLGREAALGLSLPEPMAALVSEALAGAGTEDQATAMGRRRALGLFAAAAGFGLAGVRQARAEAPVWRWQGTALGAQAELAIAHPDSVLAKRLVGLALGEVERLEAVFSLYRPDSALARLNARGVLRHPPLELVELLTRAQAWGARTGGAFDVTVQPLWDLHRRHFARAEADPGGPPRDALAQAAGLVDFRALEVTPERIRLDRPGMAVTLNGIAQGYITDRVAELLRAEGLERVLVSLGEVRGLGGRADGAPWRVALEDSGMAALADQAVATSAVAGLRFDPEGRFHHLFDPRSGRCAEGYRAASVVAARAADADALSTALVAAGRLAVPAETLRELGVVRITVVESDGRLGRLL